MFFRRQHKPPQMNENKVEFVLFVILAIAISLVSFVKNVDRETSSTSHMTDPTYKSQMAERVTGAKELSQRLYNPEIGE